MTWRHHAPILLLIAAVAVFVSTTKADTAPPIPLPQLAASRFVKLSLAEEKLVNAAANGTAADCSKLSREDRIIRGDLLSWLCTNPQASVQLTDRGVSVLGAEIAGKVDLEWAKISFPIVASQCAFKDPVILSHSDIAFLSFIGSSVTDLKADASYFEGSIYLTDGFEADGKVNFYGATIKWGTRFSAASSRRE